MKPSSDTEQDDFLLPAIDDKTSLTLQFPMNNITFTTSSKNIFINLKKFLNTFPQTKPKSKAKEKSYQVIHTEGQYILKHRKRTIFSRDTWPNFLISLEKILLNNFLSSLPQDVLLLHSSGLKIGPDVTLFVGESGAGKTTAIESLYNSSKTFLSDELIAIDLNREIIFPYRNPINPVDNPDRASNFHWLFLEDSGDNSYYYGYPQSDRDRSYKFTYDELTINILDRNDDTFFPSRRLKPGSAVIRLFHNTFRPHHRRHRLKILSQLCQEDIDIYSSR